MQKIKLDSRLMSVASLVRNGSRVIDIGTDHAYLPSYLIQSGICPSAIAADVREMPLKNAEETIKQYNLGDKIKTILSNGLESIDENSGDDIVIAGMGGILIEEILSNAPWVKSADIRIIAQPMTHAERVRSYFINNGFKIIRETASSDSKHNYCAIAAEYTGETIAYSVGYTYFGELKTNDDNDSKAYLSKQLERLKKRYNALFQSDSTNAECCCLKKVIDDFES
ncbi:MAG: class I SAM-dependent methyltransferase [Faecalibacterium sp.]|nr:class I SAM-dependent methyltransferase [Ruminococcus sp.]MCM1392346.1 class I SAM-dependent methyltransferase [Ruminococcus sp.]MCM1484658.1 class I SAM-dependent methyltransferase [Faecalibacterium sp.]